MSILKEINPEYSVGGLMLKLQYFGHLMQRANSLEKTLMLTKIESRRKRGWQDEMVGWYHWPNGHKFEQVRGDGEGQSCKESDMTEWLNNKNTFAIFYSLEVRQYAHPVHTQRKDYIKAWIPGSGAHWVSMWQGNVCRLKKSRIWGINSARESSSGKHGIGYLAS